MTRASACALEATPVNPDRFQAHSKLGFIDWVLRGIGQVVFQNNPLSGLVILLAILFNSWIYAFILVVGTVVGTGTAWLLRADRALVANGLFGFNGALVGLALVAFTSANFRSGSFPSAYLLSYIVFAAALTSIAFSSISTLMGPHKVAALTMPFNLVGWLFLFAVLKFSNIEAGPLSKPVSPDQYALVTSYLLPTWYMGIGNAIGQIFFQDNWIAGYIILFGIAINSRISAVMALLGAALAAAVAVTFGAPEGAIRDGLFGYNAALTGIALGGFFLVLNVRSFVYTLFGIVVTTWLWASVAIFLEPIRMPVFTSPFVIVTWLMLIGQHGFKALVPVPPAEATTPEDNRRRYLAKRRRE
jgi:urea transporter